MKKLQIPQREKTTQDHQTRDTEEAERLFSLANVQGKGIIIFTNQGVICQKNNNTLQLGTQNM